MERITGYPGEFFLQGPERWLSTIHPDDRDRLAEASARIISDMSPHEEEDEYRIVRPDGTVRWVRDSVVARRQADGSIRLDGVVSDITARRQAEEALKKAHDELEQKVKERTAELAIFRRFAEAAGQGFGMADMDGDHHLHESGVVPHGRSGQAGRTPSASTCPTYYPEGLHAQAGERR